MIKKTIADFLFEMINNEMNFIQKEIAINQNSIGMQIFENPLIGYANVDDELFNKLKDPEIIGTHFKLPSEWFKDGKTVVSVFFPFTSFVKSANARNLDWPTPEWLHGRIEGQAFINKAMLLLIEELDKIGIKSVQPSKESDFFSKGLGINNDISFTSNWSERHVAFVCGLGTFGLSKGLITKRGVAGRYASLIIDKKVEASIRDYTLYDEYCNLCGECIKNCPVKAISFDTGKDHVKCNDFLTIIRKAHAPRYGCGKCQVSVECESKVPSYETS